MNANRTIVVYGAYGHTGRCPAIGVVAPGAAFDARDFLESLSTLQLAFADA